MDNNNNNNKEPFAAILTISNLPGEEKVTIELKFSHEVEDDASRPISYQMMDFISNVAILPVVGAAEQMLLTEEHSDAIN